MASITLYAPIVNSTAPAFISTANKCTIQFAMATGSESISTVKGVHIAISKQSSGYNIVKKEDDKTAGRYRATGIIITNKAPTKVSGSDNLYSIDILKNDIDGGWEPGCIYKIQIRLSKATYNGSITQSSWLNENSNLFSEWSSYCITKATSTPTISFIYPINNSILQTNSLNVKGHYFNSDGTETLYSYNLTLTSGNEVIAESGALYTGQYYNTSEFMYNFNVELLPNRGYDLTISYTTINGYSNYSKIGFTTSSVPGNPSSFHVVTLEDIDTTTSVFKQNFLNQTSIGKEQEEGRIAFALFDDRETPVTVTKTLYIRRTDSNSNYTNWIDIKTIECNGYISDLPIFYDYGIESNVFYKYGVQLEEGGVRQYLNTQDCYCLREFEFSYLLGENGQQLKLKFDNKLSSYAYTTAEAKLETIGGVYATVTSNGAMRYRTFPISGTISFEMDDQEAFISKLDLYGGNADILAQYEEYNTNNSVSTFDYRRSNLFKEKVLTFLQNKKPKLFKSATEGNIIIKLINVSTAPNASVNRLICTFSATANEVAENSLDNYKKYKFI